MFMGDQLVGWMGHVGGSQMVGWVGGWVVVC